MTKVDKIGPEDWVTVDKIGRTEILGPAKNGCKYFEIPVIILSVFSSSFSVGTENFIHQQTLSAVTCSISMLVTILTSTKLYMKITENSSQEQELAIQYKSLIF